METYYMIPNKENKLEMLQIFLNIETGGFKWVPVLLDVEEKMREGNGIFVQPAVEGQYFKFLVPNKISLTDIDDMCKKHLEDKYNLLDFDTHGTIIVLASDHTMEEIKPD